MRAPNTEANIARWCDEKSWLATAVVTCAVRFLGLGYLLALLHEWEIMHKWLPFEAGASLGILWYTVYLRAEGLEVGKELPNS